MNNYFTANKNAIAILRVSSLKQEDGYSHALQEQEIRSYCVAEKLNLVRVERITESAKNSQDRKQYHAAINHALKNGIANILFYQGDRESRNFTDLEENEGYVRSGAFTIHYTRDRFVLHKFSPDSDFLQREVSGMINRQYSRGLSTKVKDAFMHKAEMGWYPSNHPPLGYVTVPVLDENGRIKKRGTTIGVDPNLANQKWVLREFELRANGLSLDSIRRQVIQEGLVPTTKIKGYSEGTISQRLRNPFYRGSFKWGDKTYPGRHEVFIPQQILDAVDRSFGMRGLQNVQRGLFSSWVRCAHVDCNCLLVYDPKKKNLKNGDTRTYHYYHCTNGRNVHASMKGTAITEEKLFEQFGASLDEFSLEETFAKQIADALQATHQKAKHAISGELDSLKETLNKLDEKHSRATDMLIENAIDRASFDIVRFNIHRDKQFAHDKVKKLTLQLTDACMDTAKTILELVSRAKLLWLSRSPQEQREFLQLVLSNPLWDGVSLQYELKKPFKVLSQMRENINWCGHLEEFRTALHEYAA